MDTSSYDAKIRQLEESKRQLLDQMETQAQTYIRESGTFCAKHFQEMVERSVTQQPDVVQSLGLERLREMKAELNALTQICSKLASDYLDKPAAWDHRNTLPEGLESKNAYRPGVLSSKAMDLCRNAGSKARGAVREIWGHIGELLLKYGLAKSGKDEEWELKHNARPRYRYAISTAKEMDAALKRYIELFESYVKTHVEKGAVEREKQQAIAKDLWDQA